MEEVEARKLRVTLIVVKRAHAIELSVDLARILAQ